MIKSMTCEHGQLARQCDYCERDREIAELRAELAACEAERDRLRVIDAKARAWLEAHDKYVKSVPIEDHPLTIAREALREALEPTK